ncbi:hypothetical protein CPS_0876 [Colwellia psychrerythraea 34H]|uniref:Uncharacterized protein n=1 Tax=Colwellia psychrerythraea (strain 34H / ATCC BAA-681) TaxID=167879 RepID=Q487Z0_COLP3|nr:hypothetical protein CPS_0876 [Colwellia psychrerythraea 34H]
MKLPKSLKQKIPVKYPLLNKLRYSSKSVHAS